MLLRAAITTQRGGALVANPESNGRFHSDWCSMIYPRLLLARDLLTEDGVIFISIDDNEDANLRKICDEIFGAQNFVAQLVVRRNGGRQDSKYFAIVHEYILCYAHSINSFTAGRGKKEQGNTYPKVDAQTQRRYKTQLLRKWGSNSLRENRPNLYYPITAPDGTAVYPMIYEDQGATFNEIEGCWRWSASNMNNQIAQGNVEFEKNKYGKWVAYQKIFEPSDGDVLGKPFTTWVDDMRNGVNRIKELFGKAEFDYPKTPDLIVRLSEMANCHDADVIMDFFSGSGTSADAVMQLNANRNSACRFVCVQLPEPLQQGDSTICDIAEERIRRAGDAIKAEVEKENAQPNLEGELKKVPDIGFRVFRIDSSNFVDTRRTPDQVMQNDVKLAIDNLKTDRTDEDLLFQVLPMLRIPYSAVIEVCDKGEMHGKTVYAVNGNQLLACFDKKVGVDTIEAIAKRKPYYAVFRDASFADDATAANFEELFKTFSPDTIRKVI